MPPIPGGTYKMKAFDQSKEDESADFATCLAGEVSDGASSRQVAEIVASAFRGIDRVRFGFDHQWPVVPIELRESVRRCDADDSFW